MKNLKKITALLLAMVLAVGLMTGCGGGIIRDVTVREIPMVFTKNIYAVASLIGGVLYYIMFMVMGTSEIAAVIAGIAAVFVLRMAASHYKWNLPRAF